MPADTAASMVPHLTNQSTVLNIHPVVLYRLCKARYAARMLMRGGMMVCGSHSHGLAAMRDCMREMRAVSRVMICERNDSRNVYSGGGSWSDRKSRRGSKKGESIGGRRVRPRQQVRRLREAT